MEMQVFMQLKKILSTGLIILGVAGLIIGLFGIFGPDITTLSPWAFAILGLIFFSSGMGLLKATGNRENKVSP